MRSNNFKKYLGLLLALLVVCGFAGCQSASALDYDKPENWAVIQDENLPVDVFFVCPTAFMGKDGSFNMSMDDEKTKEAFVGATNMEKGLYEEYANFYAPYYRQAGMNTFSDMAYEDAEKYYKLAYADVEDAFDCYMKKYNDGKPFILAGFSQGSDMLIRLMKERMGDKKLSEKMVAAYIIGWRITEEDVKKYPHLKMAKGEKDTGVIVSFNSEAPGIETSLIVPKKTLGINPLNWSTTSKRADKSQNKGAAFTNYAGTADKTVPNMTGAYLDKKRGTLKVTDVAQADYPPVFDIFQSGVYHVYDYMFFYNNLKENVKVRIDSYL